MTGDNFTYPGSYVLKNKAGIRDDAAFERWLDKRTILRNIQINEMGVPDKFDSDYLKEIHRTIFQDAFEWAGHTREAKFRFNDGTIASMRKANSNVPFAAGDSIQKGLKAFDNVLRERDNLQGLSRQQFVEQAAGIFAFINHVHPFREGNGRTQRVFFEKLAKEAGHKLDFSVITAERMVLASIAASERSDLEPMKHLFEDISNSQKTQILEEFLNSVRNHGMDEINDRNVVAAREGVEYCGQFGAVGSKSFFMIINNSEIVVGNSRDLTQNQLNHIKPNDAVAFTASAPEKNIAFGAVSDCELKN